MTAIKTGDTVTIRRGKAKGQSGEVIAINGMSHVLKLADGEFLVQNETNLKAPEEATIGASALADVISDLARTYSVGDEAELDALESLANRLSTYLPGFSAKSINWPDKP